MACDASPKVPGDAVPFGEQLGCDIVTITVGSLPNQKTFVVHKQLICQKVTFFGRMFNGQFAEGTSQKAELPEDDPATFGVFLEWLYKGVVELAPQDPLQINSHIRLFAFAEKYGIVELQDKSMELLIYTLNGGGCLPIYSGMPAAYTHMHANSKLRLFMARTFAYVTLTLSRTEGGWTKQNMKVAIEKCPELAIDTWGLMRGQNGIEIIDPREHPLCDYHQHESTEPCPYSK